jgi:hypothetical protein
MFSRKGAKAQLCVLTLYGPSYLSLQKIRKHYRIDLVKNNILKLNKLFEWVSLFPLRSLRERHSESTQQKTTHSTLRYQETWWSPKQLQHLIKKAAKYINRVINFRPFSFCVLKVRNPFKVIAMTSVSKNT